MILNLLWAKIAIASCTTARSLNRLAADNDAIRDGNRLRSLELQKRGVDVDPKVFADDALYQKYIGKGEYLICLMQATDQGAGYLMMDTRIPPSAASKWTGDLKSELKTWYWHEAQVDVEWDCDWERKGLKDAFDVLGLNSKPAFDNQGEPMDGHNNCLSLRHYDETSSDPNDEWGQMKPVKEQKYEVEGKEYTATGGFFDFAVNQVDGALIGTNLINPKDGVLDLHGWGRPAKLDELPDLRFCSDVFWGYWFRDNLNIKNLRVYGAYTVINEDTVLLVTRALKDRGISKLSVWPGDSFDADSDGGKALIGSPIGATIAHMLIGHKAELGIKHITKINVITNAPKRVGFGESPVPDIHIFFEIEDVRSANEEGKDVIRVHRL